jgi:hypothetical protein
MCHFYTMPGGCRKGNNCRFMHGSEDTAAAQASLPPPMSISMHPAVLGQQAMQYAVPSRQNAGQLTWTDRVQRRETAVAAKQAHGETTGSAGPVIKDLTDDLC